jgi:DNA modification methylase
MIPTDSLIPYANNPRHNEAAVDAVAASIKEFGFLVPIVIDKDRGIAAGDTRYRAAKKLQMPEVPCIPADHLTEAQIKAFRLADNKVGEIATWDMEALQAELQQLAEFDFDMSGFGFDLDAIVPEDKKLSVMEKLTEGVHDSIFGDFIIPPFSVLDSKQGYWQDRKQKWIELGLKSEFGRGEHILFPESMNMGSLDKGVSIFDPVLCEVIYRWFNAPGGLVVDPFAGGSVRGIVARLLDYHYIGIDLRDEQVKANRENAGNMGIPDDDSLVWVSDSSLNIDEHVDNGSCDLLFTCPPYFDLEVYSENEEDISNMSFEGFSTTYTEILKRSASKLRDNRFAVVVISDIRDPKGFYRDLTGLTKAAFQSCGFLFYNDIILLNAIGTAAVRARRNMNNRKVTRVHQNVLVFFKGDPAKIQSFFPELKELDKLPGMEDEAGH